MNNSHISVIVPVYNGETTLSECIASLLEQDYPNDKYEVIIVDNGSTDDTKKICMEHGAWSMEDPTAKAQSAKQKAKSPEIKYIYEPGKGSYRARNAGVRESRGEMLAFTDADCVAEKDWLKKGVENFTDAGVGCVAGMIAESSPQNYVEEYFSAKKRQFHEMTLNHFFLPYPATANAFYRRKIFDLVGMFEEKWMSGGDADIAWRMQLKTDMKLLFVPGSKVFHKHRSTLRSMAKQAFKWGRGSVNLYEKYRDHMTYDAFRGGINFAKKMPAAVFRTIVFMFKDKTKMNSQETGEFLDEISYLGEKAGCLFGSIKKRVFYV